MMQGGRPLVKPTMLARRIRRLLTTVPWLSSRTRLQLFFAQDQFRELQSASGFSRLSNRQQQ
jgi:hypothetical protein